METDKRSLIVKTIGHSTHTIDEFIHLLQLHEITLVVDVRSIPRSRHNPQFNKDELSAHLKSAGICYVHMLELGGLRHPLRNSLTQMAKTLHFEACRLYANT
jgi:uncharacterized protein (DUF488 family)